MTANELHELEHAWRQATDADVRRALLDLNEMLPAAIPIIQAEAVRRGIDVARLSEPSVPASVLLRNALFAIARYLWVTRWIRSLLLGLTFLVVIHLAFHVLEPRGPMPWLIFYFALLIGVNAIADWPLRSVKVLVVSAGLVAVGSFVPWAGHIASSSQINDPDLNYYLLLAWLVLWVVPFLILSPVIWWRRTYRPLFPPGSCQRCGYE